MATRSNVLLTLGILFTIGGATRIIPHTFAEAENSPPAAQEEAGSAADANDGARLIQAAYEPGRLEEGSGNEEVCFTGDAASAMAEDQKNFEARTQALQEQELSLQARKQELDRQSEELKALQASLEDRWQEMSATADEDIQHLAQMYSSMKPDQAAEIFDQMDAGFAAGFLRLMPSEQAGGILAGMQTDKAYVVSVKLASRNRDIREGKQQQP